MHSRNNDFMRAYMESLTDREAEANSVEKKDTVENTRGERFIVEAVSKNFDDIKEYDKTGEATSYRKYSKHVNENTLWVAVKDGANDIYVYPYNDEGVCKIYETDQTLNATYKRHNSIMDIYSEITKTEE